MAEIYPYRALLYDPARVPLAAVVTQPYDKITPAMQERYYAASPYNLVRIILGKPEREGSDVYAQAAKHFGDWRRQGILREDPVACIYAYHQEFAPPNTNRTSGARQLRRGFIALGKIHDYGDRVIFRHEQTLAKPKADRLQLLRATRAHFGQIFMLYSDPQARIDQLLEGALADAKAEFEIKDEYGVLHRLWPIADESIIRQVQSLMRDQQLVIADGHHRYETALAYREERRAASAKNVVAASASLSPIAPYEKVMMTFINIDSPGLLILPTHRVLKGVDAEKVRDLPQNAASLFKVRKLFATDLESAQAQLAAAGNSESAFLLVTDGETFLLAANAQKVSAALSTISERQRRLDVVVLHKLLLEQMLGLSEESIREQKNIAYVREADDAVGSVRSGAAQAAFLMNPVRIEQLRSVALAGEFMPQKSTDFYPKLLSGLTIYATE